MFQLKAHPILKKIIRNDKVTLDMKIVEEEYTPKLFSEEQSYQSENHNLENSDQKNNEIQNNYLIKI